MLKLLRQARNTVFVFFLLFTAAWPVHGADEGPDEAIVEGETTVMRDLFSGIAGVFDGIFSSEEEKPEEAAPQTIEAKRLDQDEKDKKKPLPEPYKIYASPVLTDERAYATEPPLRLMPSISSPESPQMADVEKQVLPPITAFPKQFFPILPMAALPDTPPQYLPVASSEPLLSDHGYVTRAVIVIHDIQRDAAQGIATLMTLGGQNDKSTLILAPQFPLELDVKRFADHLPEQGQQIARWPVNRGWQIGGESLLPSSRLGVSSFSAIDLLLLYLADQKRFPQLRQVVLVGHGMGADFVQRYAAVGQAIDVLGKQGLPVRFVVANPSSYLYFTAQRPSKAGPTFMRADSAACPKVNAYPYGLQELATYPRRIGASAIRLSYPDRHIVYLVGDRIGSDNYLERDCAAQAQGEDRASRARHYAQHLVQSFGPESGKNQFFVLVPRVGFDPVAIWGSPCGIISLFGDGNCGQ